MFRALKGGRAPALIASSLVLAAAIGGTAIAASGGSAPSKRSAKAQQASVKRTVDREIHKLAPRLHVAFAKNSNNASRSNGATTMDGYKKTGVVYANVGQRVDLLTIGPFKFSLLCRQGVATASPAEGSVVGEVDLLSTEDKTAIASSSTSQAAEFPANTQFPLTDRSTSTNPKAAPDEPNFDGDGGLFTALAPSGTVVHGNAFVGTHLAGHDCAGGMFVFS